MANQDGLTSLLLLLNVLALLIVGLPLTPAVMRNLYLLPHGLQPPAISDFLKTSYLHVCPAGCSAVDAG